MSRNLLLLVALGGLLALTTGCYVHASVNSRHSHPHTSYHRPHGHAHGHSRTTVSWVYYPEHDIYYAAGAGHWCYYDGGRWVVVTSRPSWFRHSSSTTVRLEYTGSRPFDHWHNHRTRWGARYHRSHNAPRVWGHSTHRSYSHGTHRGSSGSHRGSSSSEHRYEEHEYRYSERRRY